MQLHRKKAKFFFTCLDQLVEEKALETSEAERLKNQVEIIKFDWKRLANIAFLISIASFIIFIFTLLSQDFLVEILSFIFDFILNLPTFLISFIIAIFSAFILYLGLKRQQSFPNKVFSNEALFFVASLFIGFSLFYFIEGLTEIFTIEEPKIFYFTLAWLIYGGLGLWLASNLIWFISLLFFSFSLNFYSGYVSGWGLYFISMEKPIVFVIVGMLLFAASFIFKIWKQQFFQITRVIALLYFFIALWILSVGVTEADALVWSLLFAIAALVSIFVALRYDDATLRGFGITFLAINLYTKFFEFFWGDNKIIFFGIIAITFWIIGSKAEQIWELKFLKKAKHENIPS